MYTTIYSPFFPLVIFLITYCSVFYMRMRVEETSLMQREVAIDGLRGILALMVVFCHAGCWYLYATTGRWDYPTPLFFHLGHTGVTLFFMITAFLFTSKLLNHSTSPISWSRLYVSRILRIYPLFISVITIVIFIVLIETNFNLNVPLSTFITSIFKWYTFTMFGSDNINGYQGTFSVIASVQWTLIFEWFFYLALPIIGVIFFKNKSYGVAIICALLLAVVIPNAMRLNANINFLPKAFLTGILVAVISKKLKLHAFLRSPIVGFLAIMLIYLQFLNLFQLGPKNQDRQSILFLSMAFFVIAHGNLLLGLLNTKTMRFLGDISYGIYLMHGIVYFCVLKYVVGLNVIKTVTPITYWFIVGIVTLTTVFLAYLSYCYIEMPAMKHLKPIATWLKAQSNLLNNKIKLNHK